MAILKLGNSKQIYYELIDGDEGRPHLIFLHEGLGCTEMWRAFPRTLCSETGCPGIVYDRLGYGRSSPFVHTRTVHYLHAYALSELPEFIARLIPAKGYFLVGHSDGGSIALIHASEKPAQLRGIITEAAHVFVEKETLDGIRAAANAFRAGKLQGLSKYHGEKTEGVFWAWADTWLRDWFKYWNIEYLLPSIDCPVLALQGSEDQYGTAAQVESIASRAAYAEREIIKGCGHAPHEEQSVVVLRLMKEFLQDEMREF